MITEIGHFALILALVMALIQGTLPLIGSLRANARLMALAKPVARGQFLFVVIAFGCLTYAFATNDFSLVNVAQNSNSKMPMQYKISAVWGSHEGSLLLWALMLAFWTFAVTIYSRRLPEEMLSRILSVMGLISVGFISFMLFTSNPFDRLIPAALDGRDLNPLLQDIGMIFHPPMLYMGYVGFSVAFSFAIAALIGGKLDATWARWSRPWTTVAWLFLTIGIAMGSWWAYYELGWGGWWFWDPVENASFMPWLIGTALIHSLAVTEKRGSFKNWTVLLAIMAFSFSLLGTFLVRSGVLTSVHAFATDPERGVYILAFLIIVIGGSLTLFAWRAPKVGLGSAFGVISRESFLLLNNVILTVAAASVMLGTLYPLFLDSLGMGKISVGPPYFDAVFAPLMAVGVFLLGVGPFARWKEASLAVLAKQLWPWLLVSVAIGVFIPLALGKWSAPVMAGIGLGVWAVLSTFAFLVTRVRETSGVGVLTKLRTLPRSTWGMLFAHFGIGIFVLGVSFVRTYEVTSEMRMQVGETTTVGGYAFRFLGVEGVTGPNYESSRGTLEVTKNGKILTTLHPEKRMYTVQKMPTTEAAIDTSIWRDLFVALGEPVGNDEWVVRIQHRPLIVWIWAGCLIMAFGGLLAATDRRYRLPAPRREMASGQALTAN